MPDTNMEGNYTLSDDSHDDRPRYDTSDGVYDIRYHSIDNTWKLRNMNTQMTLITVTGAKETPYSSPESDYVCRRQQLGITFDETYW